MSFWDTIKKIGNTAADFTPIGWASRAVNGKGAFTNAAGLVGMAAGQNDNAVPLESQPFAGDADNALAQQQQASIAKYQQYQDDIAGKNGQIRQAWAQQQPPPAPPISDQQVRAEQVKNDRARLLGAANVSYRSLEESLSPQAFGNPDAGAPSAAMSTLQAATDRNIRSNYGMAAGAEGTGGQRSALMQAAMGNAATQNQAAANSAVTLRAQEHQQNVQNQLSNRQLLSQAMGDQSNLYNTLYSGDSNREDQNLNAAVSRDTGEANRNAANAAGKQAIVKSVIGAAARMGGASGGG
jgi:hypothetical protein